MGLSIDMQGTIQRRGLLENVVLRLQESPAAVVLGARQVGKTTLAGQVAKQSGATTVFDLERSTGRAALQNTPELALADCQGLVVIDEIQRMPELYSILRPLCDDPDRKATFLLLGSASPELVRGVSESLAGRVQFVSVSGFSLADLGGHRQDRLRIHGGFPRAYLAPTPLNLSRWPP